MLITLTGTDPLMVEGLIRYVPVVRGEYNSFDLYPNTTFNITVTVLGSTTPIPSPTITTLASPPASIHPPFYKLVDSRNIRFQWESGWTGFTGNPLDTLD